MGSQLEKLKMGLLPHVTQDGENEWIKTAVNFTFLRDDDIAAQ